MESPESFFSHGNGLHDANEPPTQAIDLAMSAELDAVVDASHRFVRIAFTKPRAVVDSTPFTSSTSVSVARTTTSSRDLTHNLHARC